MSRFQALLDGSSWDTESTFDWRSRDDVVDLNSEMPSYLVPIRIEFETDKLRIRDCFTWNIEGETRETAFGRI